MRRFITILVLLAVYSAGNAQTFDKEKLDRFFDKLAEKNKAMGSLYMAANGNAIYQRSIGYSYINQQEKKLSAQTQSSESALLQKCSQQ